MVTVTNPFKKALQERGVKNIRVIPNGADSNTFLLSTKRKTGHPFKLFYSGGVGGYYRLDIVVKALKLVVNRGYTDVVLVFAGTGTVDEVLSIAKKLGISKNIQYLGVINDQKKLAELISEADIGIIPYDDNLLWRDSLPAKFFEYCSCGLPVVSTSFDDSIISQLIKDNSIGLFSDPLNIELLAKNIIEFYTDETFRKKSAVNARQFIETQFDRRVLSKDYLDIICSLL